MNKTVRIPCVFMRTGTSKALYFRAEDLPEDAGLRDRYLLAAMGSPDLRQIDGMGGGDVSTSKIAIISRSARPGFDVDYTFGQVSLTAAKIDYSGNCGNCSSGVGPYAIDEGLVEAVEPRTRVRVYNTNTDSLLLQTVRVEGGRAAVHGDCVLDGVPGAWSPIDLDFRDTVGATTGSILPTGNRRDHLEVPGLGSVEVTIADLGNPVVFFRAEAVGATGLEPRPQINGDDELMERVEAVRQAAAQRIGLVKPGEVAREVSSMKPLVVFFGAAADYPDYVSGETIAGGDMDFAARNLLNQSCIDTFAVTAGLCTGVVARISGTVLHEVAKPGGELVRIGHSRGVSEVLVAVSEQDGAVTVEKAVMQRTARRIMRGEVSIDL